MTATNSLSDASGAVRSGVLRDLKPRAQVLWLTMRYVFADNETLECYPTDAALVGSLGWPEDVVKLPDGSQTTVKGRSSSLRRARRELLKVGALVKVGRAYHGHAQVYRVEIPRGAPANPITTKGVTGAQEGVHGRPTKGVTGAPPTPHTTPPQLPCGVFTTKSKTAFPHFGLVDLTDPRRRAVLLEELVCKRFIPRTESDRELFKAKVENAIRIAKDPCAMVAAAIADWPNRKGWSAGRDEDAASRRRNGRLVTA